MMKRGFILAMMSLFLSANLVQADDPKLEDLLGKWELTADTAGIPKGSTFDFQKDGKLVVVAEVGGEKKSFTFKYEMKAKEKQLSITLNDKTDTTSIVTLDKMELVCKDKDGTVAKFKRAK